MNLLAALVLAAIAVSHPPGIIRGVVVGSNGHPVPHAVVEAKGLDGQMSQAAIADDAGQFELNALPEGRYLLTGRKAAYLDAVFGATVPGTPGAPIHVSGGAAIDGLRLELHRGGVLAGQAVALDGTPLPWHRVDVLRLARSGRRDALKRLVTDDRGQFRAFGLPAGRYTVCVGRERMPFDTGATSLTEQMVEGLLAELARGRQPTVSHVNEARGPEAHHDGRSCVGDSPGAEIALSPGQAVEEINVPVLPVWLSRISGTAPRASSVILVPTSANLGLPQRESKVSESGTFAIDDVPPGNYRLIAMGGNATAREGGMLELAAAGGNIEGISILLTELVTVSGRITTGAEANAAVPSGLVVNLISTAADPFAARLSRGSLGAAIVEPSAGVHQDGSFRVSGVLPGSYRVQIEGLRSGWQLKALSRSGQIFEGNTLRLVDQEGVTDLRVLIDTSKTGIIGEVRTPSHLRSSDHMVLAFPRDSGLWGDPDRLALSGPDQHGRFELMGMIPGSYWLVAAPRMALDALIDQPGALEALVLRATPVEVVDGQVLAVALEIGGEQ